MTEFELLVEYENSGNIMQAERLIIQDVKQAINDNSELKDLYLSMGPTARHRVMNLNHYYHNLRFGFTHKDLDKYDWLKSGVFEIERIEFATSFDRENPYIELGKSPNGKWSWGYSLSMGSTGGGSSTCVFREPIATRNEAFDIAIAYAEKEYKGGLNRNDSTNFNETLINQVLKSIEKIKIDSNQLALF